MVVNRFSRQQTDPPRSPRETLPTMYDLPCEDLREPGLPDEFHDFQPELLSETLRLSHYSANNFFTGADLNLYYDVRHQRWYKRPDWFLVLGVPRFYDHSELRLSYVMWQEGVSPFVVVELLSPGTEKEDLGQTLRDSEGPPTKWEVYEQILRIPYYIVFDRYSDRFQAFGLHQGSYQALTIQDQRLWIPELDLGIGVWQGSYKGFERNWLRWYDSHNDWIPTDAESLAQERQRVAETEALLLEEQQKQARLFEKLRAQGIDPDTLLS